MGEVTAFSVVVVLSDARVDREALGGLEVDVV